MNTVTIYHNPSCSKSQEALEYLQARGCRPHVIRYLDTPPTESEIRELIRKLGIAASGMVRATDFQRLGLQPSSDPDQMIALISKHPILMQRPIVVVGEQARIANPPNVVDELLSQFDVES